MNDTNIEMNSSEDIEEGNNEEITNNIDLSGVEKELSEIKELLIENLTTEEVTEDFTEEVTEEIDPEDLPIVKRDLNDINGGLENVYKQLQLVSSQNEIFIKNQERIIEEQEIAQQSTTEDPEIILNDKTADNHLYLSSTVENADLNDIYSVLLSTRNILLLFILFFFGLKLISMLKSVIYRLMNI